MQNQLFEVENEAALLVAQHAMEHPPACLMAAIVPAAECSQNVVGAWSGTKPYKMGGGAPCPSEFLLRKEARQLKDEESEESNGKSERTRVY